MKFDRNTGASNNQLIKEIVFNLVRGFVSWIVLSPMIYSWGLLIFVLFVITFINFQDGTVELFSFIGKTVSELVEKYPYLERLAIAEPSSNKEAGIDLGGEDFENYIFKVYAILTIPLALLGSLINLIRGPTLPPPVNNKLKFLGAATLLAIVVFFANFIFGSQTYHGSIFVWSLIFIMGPGIVFVISLSSLFLSRIVMSIEGLSQDNSGSRQV
ncbi:MAG: hypothetical protein U9N50_02830 [Pseudomonadota bacterium]|nr:hypothetical protein [Pseudomonadota bacterium]